MTASGPESFSTFLLFWGLMPLGFFYRLIMRIRYRLYRSGLKKSYRASVPVVSVGNLTTSGTGKTPMVDFLAKELKTRGIKAAIVSRGYGGKYQQAVGRVTGQDGRLRMSPQECGDEPYLLAARNQGTPVYVARQRALGVQAAEQEGAQLILLDDGFQHLAVQRDVDIVLLDAQNPFGNGHMLPAGKLREPLSALQRASLVVVTRSDSAEKQSVPVDCPIIRSCHKLSRVVRSLDGSQVPERDYLGKSCLAFAGIAKPDSFFLALRELGFAKIEEIPLLDHQEYTQDVLNRLIESCDNYDFLITTEKDAVKLSATGFPKPCYQVGVELNFDDPGPLITLLDNVVTRCR